MLSGVEKIKVFLLSMVIALALILGGIQLVRISQDRTLAAYEAKPFVWVVNDRLANVNFEMPGDGPKPTIANGTVTFIIPKTGDTVTLHGNWGVYRLFHR